jgi:hypothetical protein
MADVRLCGVSAFRPPSWVHASFNALSCVKLANYTLPNAAV